MRTRAELRLMRTAPPNAPGRGWGSLGTRGGRTLTLRGTTPVGRLAGLATGPTNTLFAFSKSSNFNLYIYIYFFPWKKKAAVVPFESFTSFKTWLSPANPLIPEKPTLFPHLKAKICVISPEQEILLRVEKQYQQKKYSVHSLAFTSLKYKNATGCGSEMIFTQCIFTQPVEDTLLPCSLGHSPSCLVRQSLPLFPIQTVSCPETLVSLLH